MAAKLPKNAPNAKLLFVNNIFNIAGFLNIFVALLIRKRRDCILVPSPKSFKLCCNKIIFIIIEYYVNIYSGMDLISSHKCLFS